MTHFDNSISGFTNDALDAAYIKATKSMFEQIIAITTNAGSAMWQSLAKLDEEAARLDADEEIFALDNAQLTLTLGVHRDTLIAIQSLITANAAAIEASGAEIAPGSVTAKVFIAIATLLALAGSNPVTSLAAMQAELAAVGIVWTVPASADVFAAGFVNSPEWIAKMEAWGAGYADLTSDIIIEGIATGMSPIETARIIRNNATNFTLSAAENLTRTLQLTSYREASVAMELLNNDFLEYKIRIATLDQRTCAACIALHGTRLEIGERVDDHYRGRCTEFYVVKDGERFPGMMQSDSLPGQRNFVPYQNGEDWFASLSPARQAQQATFLNTPAKLRAYQDGVPLSDFIGDYTDKVFGHQFVELSLVKAISEDAEQYYNINQ